MSTFLCYKYYQANKTTSKVFRYSLKEYKLEKYCTFVEFLYNFRKNNKCKV